MLETVLADISQQLLQSANPYYPGPAECVQRIIRELALTHVSVDPAGQIVGREAREAHGARLDLPHASPVRVFDSYSPRDNRLKVHLHLLEEMFGQVRTMEAHRFIRI